MSDCSYAWYEHLHQHMYCELSSGKGCALFAISLHQKTITFSKNAESKMDKKKASNTSQFLTADRETQEQSYSKQSTLFHDVYM